MSFIALAVFNAPFVSCGNAHVIPPLPLPFAEAGSVGLGLLQHLAFSFPAVPRHLVRRCKSGNMLHLNANCGRRARDSRHIPGQSGQSCCTPAVYAHYIDKDNYCICTQFIYGLSVDNS